MRANGDNNLVVLTLYIIGVTYTFNRMVESIDDQVKFEFDKKAVDEKLEEQNIKADVGIGFKFKPHYGFGDLTELSVTIENKSKNIAIYIDWDNCSLVVEHTKQSRRVIRKSPDLTRDLAVPQSPSLIAPTKTLSAAVTAEDVFERDAVAGTYTPKKPLVDISGLEKSPVPAMRKLYKNFVSRKVPLNFSLQLVLRLSDDLRVGLVPGENKPTMYIIDCPFTIKKLPWTYALPWNRKR
jgi:hypothetical protein